jgi:hypothetical protein
MNNIIEIANLLQKYCDDSKELPDVLFKNVDIKEIILFEAFFYPFDENSFNFFINTFGDFLLIDYYDYNCFVDNKLNKFSYIKKGFTFQEFQKVQDEDFDIRHYVIVPINLEYILHFDFMLNINVLYIFNDIKRNIFLNELSNYVIQSAEIEDYISTFESYKEIARNIKKNYSV